MAEDPGFLLVQAGLVRDDELLTAREARAQGGGTLGEHLVLNGVVDDDTLTAFYATKLVIPRIAADDLARIPASVLKRIPADMAAEFRVVPVAADGELNLTLAMSDPADKHVVDEVAFFTGSYVVRAVATQLQIAWCLAHYYGVMTPLARARLMGEAENANPTNGPTAGTSTPLIPPGTPWEMDEEEETGPARMPLMRRRPVRRRTSELAPRSGTLEVPAEPREPERLPAVLVDDDELTGRRTFGAEEDEPGAEEHEELEAGFGDDEKTAERRPASEEPILLDRRTGRNAVDGVALRGASGSGEILLLDHVKKHEHLASRQPEPILGPPGPVDSLAQSSHDTESSRGNPWAENKGENDTVRRQSKVDRRGRRSRDQATTEPSEATADPPSEAPAAAEDSRSRADSADEQAEPPTDPGEVTTNPMLLSTGAAGSANARSDWNVDEGWDMDDGWGPRGTTIPPDYLGARLGSEDGDDVELGAGTPAPPADAAAVNAASASAAAALAALPALPAIDSAAIRAVAVSVDDEPEGVDPAELAADLERSSNRLLETLRALERARGRDEVVDLLFDHMGVSLRRRAFFAVKGGVLFAFRQQGAARPGIGVAQLSLDQPSTFGQVALNRLPYRGTLSPAAVEFVERALGSPGKGESVVVPVAVRGRAVGLLYGDGLIARLFDEHQMVLGRAAGQALERILATRAAKP